MASNSYELMSSGGYIIKTHYPIQSNSGDHLQIIKSIASKSVIVMIRRKSTEVFQSAVSWGLYGEGEMGKFKDDERRFQEFWSDFDSLVIDFEELVDKKRFPDAMRKIGDKLGVSCKKHLVYPSSPKRGLKLYLAKGLTRLLGRYSPWINTTIRFAQTPK